MPRDIEQLDDLLMDVLEDVPGCSDEVVLKSLDRSARNFLDRTGLWTKKIVMSIVASQQEYTPVLSEPAYIRRIIGVKCKSDSTDDFALMDPLNADLYELVEDVTLNFLSSSYAPDYALTDGMQIEVELRPTLNNADLPLWIIDRYGDGIAAGAKAILMAQKKKPWSDLQGVVDNTYLYNRSLTDALNFIRHGKGNSISRGPAV